MERNHSAEGLNHQSIGLCPLLVSSSIFKALWNLKSLVGYEQSCMAASTHFLKKIPASLIEVSKISAKEFLELCNL